MRDYSKISPKLWRSKRFRDLSDTDSRLLYVYLLTCEHQTSAGCFRLPDAYAAADLDWTATILHDARDKLTVADLILHDADTDEVLVKRWFKHNPPTNPKHLKGVERLISELDSDVVREAAEAELEDHRANRNPLDDACDPLGPGRRDPTKTAYFNGLRS